MKNVLIVLLLWSFSSLAVAQDQAVRSESHPLTQQLKKNVDKAGESVQAGFCESGEDQCKAPLKKKAADKKASKTKKKSKKSSTH